MKALPILLATLIPSLATAQETSPSLWYSKPAENWSAALPIGNGRLGAMVYGGIEKERIQLNEDTLWSGGPHSYDNPEAYSHLAEVRALLNAEKYAQAEDLAQKMMGVPIHQAAYQPFGDLHLEFPDHAEASDYRRELDLAKAIATVTYRIGDAEFTRKTFASHPDQAIVIRLECSQPGQINFDRLKHQPTPIRVHNHRRWHPLIDRPSSSSHREKRRRLARTYRLNGKGKA